MRRVVFLLGVTLIAEGCTVAGDPGNVPPLLDITPDQVQALLAQSDRPMIINVWASWCIPCRSEAPLLREAHPVFGADIRFVGINIRDSQDRARAFLNEFSLDGFEYYFGRAGRVPGSLGAGGVPLTFFFDATGKLFKLHPGVIDERTLALNVDELVRTATG